MTRYELIERIGAGGMAEIFRGKAIAAGGFEKPVAIKRILPHLSQDRRFVELLIAEANILSHLRHRNIVQIFDVGLGDDGQYFLVMEYVDGADLGALQRRLEARHTRMPITLALHLGAEVCEALEHAHSARGPDQRSLRIVHRDVSPSNILISRSGEVKLTDFGIAKRPEEVTGHGGVRGKFAYISPEQARNTHVDARSDVYSLGIVVYEMVVGQRLFSHLPDFDALRAVREGVVRRPREVDPAIEPEVEEILLKALAHDPAQRFVGAGELGARLRGLRYSMESSGDPSKEMAQLLDAAMAEVDPEASATPAGAGAGASASTSAGAAAAAARGKEREGRARQARESEPREDSRDDTWQGRDSRSDLHEPTVVRIHTAAGFTTTGTDVLATDTASFLKAKILLDAFEEEETQAMSGIPQGMRDELSGGKPLGKRRPWAQDTSEEETQLVEARRLPARTPPPPTPATSGPKGSPPAPNGPKGSPPAPKPKAGLTSSSSPPLTAPRLKPVSAGPLPPPAVAAVVPSRAATPTIRELFHRGGLLDRDTGASARARRPPVDARRRRWILLGGTAVLVAIVSFLIARIVLGDEDANPAAVVDAGTDPGPLDGTAPNDAGGAGAGAGAAATDAAAKPAGKKPAVKKPPAKKPPAKKPPAKKPPAKKPPAKSR